MEAVGKGMDLHVMTTAPKIEKSNVGVSFCSRSKETHINIYIRYHSFMSVISFKSLKHKVWSFGNSSQSTRNGTPDQPTENSHRSLTGRVVRSLLGRVVRVCGVD